jgi:hypothetical protein
VGGNRAASAAIARVTCTIVAVVALAAGGGGCGSDDTQATSDVEPADAYTAIVEWQAGELEPVVDDNGAVQLPVIYIVSADGETIDVGVQADVAASTVDIATVRFADDSGDSFDADLDDDPVRDDGVMLLVGAMPQPAPTVTVDLRRYVGADESEPFQLEIAKNADSETTTGRSSATVTSVTRP